MSLPLYIVLAAILVSCIAVLLFGVYADHVRQQRRRRRRLLTIEIKGDSSKLAEALRPTGGSYRNCEDAR